MFSRNLTASFKLLLFFSVVLIFSGAFQPSHAYAAIAPECEPTYQVAPYNRFILSCKPKPGAVGTCATSDPQTVTTIGGPTTFYAGCSFSASAAPPSGTYVPSSAPTFTPPAATQSSTCGVTNLGQCFKDALQAFASVLLALLAVIVVAAGGLVGLFYVLILSILNTVFAAIAQPFLQFILEANLRTAVSEGWQITRNIANLFILFGLLVTALKLILEQSVDDAFKQISKIIFVALLINFSLLAFGVVYDIGSVLLVSILPPNLGDLQVSPIVVDWDMATRLFGFFVTTLKQVFMPEGSSVFKIETTIANITTLLAPLFIIVLAVFGGFMSLVLKGYILYLLAARFAISAVIITLFPFAMAAELVPFAGGDALAKQKDQFTSDFTKWMVQPIIFLLVISLGVSIVAATINAGIGTLQNVTIRGFEGNLAKQAAQITISLMIAAAIYVMVFMVAKKFAPIGTAEVEKLAKDAIGKAAGLTLGAAGVATGGMLTAGVASKLAGSLAGGKLNFLMQNRLTRGAAMNVHDSLQGVYDAKVEGVGKQWDANWKGSGEDAAILARFGGNTTERAMGAKVALDKGGVGGLNLYLANLPGGQAKGVAEQAKKRNWIDENDIMFTASNPADMANRILRTKVDHVKQMSELLKKEAEVGNAIKRFNPGITDPQQLAKDAANEVYNRVAANPRGNRVAWFDTNMEIRRKFVQDRYDAASSNKDFMDSLLSDKTGLKDTDWDIHIRPLGSTASNSVKDTAFLDEVKNRLRVS